MTKLLIIAQKVDHQDPVLGFFHRWIEELAKHNQKIIVICLQKGDYDLPANVKVLSLGKESGQSRFKYLWRFYKYIWQERQNYDSVFIHMNQEYVLLGWKLWKLLGKKIYLWRNHHAGNWLTDLTAIFCTKIFCTSKYSYTAKYKKTVIMPIGVDLDIFKPDQTVIRKPNSILFLGRIAPTKNVHIFIEALDLLKKQGLDLAADIYGSVATVDQAYAAKLTWPIESGVPNQETPKIYSAHELYVNLSSSGMYDKTIFEAMACGCLVLASNQNLVGQLDERLIVSETKTPAEVAEKIKIILSLIEADKKILIEQEARLVKAHSLTTLAAKLESEMNP